jgi:hypothetical protein
MAMITIGLSGVEAHSQLHIREVQAACNRTRNSSPSLMKVVNFVCDVREVPDRQVEVLIGSVPHSLVTSTVISITR